MKVITWNCRGVGKDSFTSVFKDLVHLHKPDMFFLCETRVSFVQASRIIARLKFLGTHMAPISGMDGGIWMLCNSNILEVDIIDTDDQSIHAIIGSGDNQWLLSGIYAKPFSQCKLQLYDKLRCIAEVNRLLWMVCGDFNEVQYAYEKRGGAPINVSHCLTFNSCLNSCGLMDLGFCGPTFTWTNKRSGLGRICERLDHVVANSGWRTLFPDAMTFHLSRTHSDYHPILIDSVGNFQTPKIKPFKFEFAWFSPEDCLKLIEDIWDSSPDLYSAMGTTPTWFNKWKKDVFENIFKRKRHHCSH